MIKNFVLDVDGVLTDGKFYYTSVGKMFKAFGADDSDALSLIKHRLNIVFVTGDKRGFEISRKRIEDMGFELHLVSTHKRLQWIQERYSLSETIYMGDGIFDSLVFEHVGYSIAPANAFVVTKKSSDYLCDRSGGDGAVAEAVVHIVEEIFKEKFIVEDLLKEKNKYDKNEQTL